MTLEGLSSVCAKLEPASYKNNEILEINVDVLQKFTSHALDYHHWLTWESVKQLPFKHLIFLPCPLPSHTILLKSPMNNITNNAFKHKDGAARYTHIKVRRNKSYFNYDPFNGDNKYTANEI